MPPAGLSVAVCALASLLALTVLGCEPRVDPQRHEAPSATVATPIAPPPVPPPAPIVTVVAPSPLPARPLRILVGGDLLPHRPSLVAPAAIQAALAPLAPLFGEVDAVIANYEAATGEVDHRANRLAYAAPHGWLEALPAAGIKAVTVANNHACDLGAPGLDATLDAAKASGLLALGAAAEDPWAPQTIATANGRRICAIAWTTISNSVACAKGHRLAEAKLNVIGKQRIDAAFARARAECDATIAIFHGGNEYAPQTTQVLDQAAHAAEAGAAAVIIHHPHIASPVIIHTTHDGRQVPLFASVGNLVTNQGESWKPPMFPVLAENRHLVCVNGWTRLGVLADLTFRFDEKETHLDWGMHLLWIDNEHATDRNVAVPKIAARLLDAGHDRAIIEKLSEDTRGPLALFSDPCWLEHGTSSPRCSTSAGGPPSPPVMTHAATSSKKHDPRPRR